MSEENTPALQPEPKVAPGAQESKMFSSDYVKELREENAAWRTRLRDAEGRFTTAEQAAEQAKAQAEAAITEARSNADARVIRAEMKAAALAAGLVDVDALRMLDTSGIKLDEDGNIVIPDGFWDSARASKPYIFAQTGAATGTTSQTARPPTAKAPQPRSAKDMTPEEYRAARDALLRQ